MSTSEKVRINRARRMAQRQGLALKRNPRKDPRAVDYGSYMLVDLATNGLVADFGWNHPSGGDHLTEVERYLDQPAREHTGS